jgi:outer membrane protein OmpA-like peptidoglycan-associated protein
MLKRMMTMVGAALVALGMAGTASAQELSLRLEPGVAFPLGQPQDQRFNPGFEGAAKVDVGVLPYFDFGPAVSYLVLPSNVSGVSAGTATFLGGFARFHRSHAGTETGITALAPWIEGDIDYTRTGPLDRFSYTVQVGAALPTSSAHNIWVGPFLAIQDVVQSADPGINPNDDKNLLVGLSFEFGAKSSTPPAPVVVEKTVFVPRDTPCPAPVVAKETTPQLDYTVLFPFDSAVLKSSQQHILDEAVATINAECKNGCNVHVDGYASSEGQLAYNKKLSSKRADAVVAYMTSHGMSKEATVISIGRGILSPVGDNKSPAGRAVNRRAEITIHLVVLQHKK